ncbi:RES family NAD+ phosphorylase [Allohahella marinimesophila]|uniref:RES family NAD+ phosphorylase n=1 Tax=Allohahella marinimesophila TaxID=1054972 RepID=UPI0031D72BA2
MKSRFANNPFSGEGARLAGGRWNSKGLPCVYVGSSESLTILEIMVHLDDYALLDSYRPFQVVLPDDLIEVLSHDQLPPNWANKATPKETTTIGDAWLRKAESVALAVPSVIVPRETNYVLNPAHGEFANILASAVELEFNVDERLRK